MKLTIPQPELAKALSFAVSAIEKRQTLAILSNLLVRTSGNQVSFTGTDLEIENYVEVGASVDRQGEITVPARKLNDIVKSTPQDLDITLAVNNNGKLIVKSGRSRFTLSTLPASGFPYIEINQDSANVKFGSDGLLKAIKSCSACMADGDVRYYLNGMLFEISLGSFNIVATDGHRLAKSVIPSECEDDARAIIPRKAVPEIQKMLEHSGSPSIDISKTHIVVKNGGMRVVSKLVDGKYPDYERVIPKNNQDTTIVNRQELVNGCGRGLILANEKYRGLRLGFSSGELMIMGNNPDQEQAEEIIPCRHDGPDKELGINGKYLLDALAPIQSENVTISNGDLDRAIMMQDENLTMVVMLMRL